MRWSDQEVSRPKPSVWRFSTKSCSVDEEHERESMLVFWRRFDGTTSTSGESLWRRRSRCCSCRGELGSGLLRMELEALVELAMEKEKTAAVAKSLRFAILVLSVRWTRALSWTVASASFAHLMVVSVSSVPKKPIKIPRSHR